MNWDNYHFTCSNCGQPVEYGQEEFHYKKLCAPERLAKTPEEVMRAKWKTISKEIKSEIFERGGNRCSRCGATKDLTVDHIIPISKGGTNDLSNLQVLCATCNRQKAAK